MNNKDYEEICDLLYDLKNEFTIEEDKLKEITRDHAYRIDELEQQIYSARKSEDIDFRVFSPRNISVDNSEKITALEKEKSELEREKSEADKRIRYFSGKSEKLNRIIYIVKENYKNGEYSVSKDKPNDKDVFDSIIENNEEKVTDYELDEVQKLFMDSDSSIDKNIDDIFSPKSNILEGSDENVEADSETIIEDNEEVDDSETVKEGIPVVEIKRVCHKVELSEKIINNDRVRAKMQLKEVISDLKDMISAYSK